MGWREVIIQTVWDYTGCTDARAETTAAGIEDRLAEMPTPDRIALARELLAGTAPTGNWDNLQEEAQRYVRDKPQWQRWIDGTPMDNDVPVWMADFALTILRRFACRAAMLEPDDTGG